MKVRVRALANADIRLASFPPSLRNPSVQSNEVWAVPIGSTIIVRAILKRCNGLEMEDTE